MTGRRIAGVALALSIAAAPAFAQSLADVARQEEARRGAAATPKAKKTYSNKDLGPGGVPEPAPAAVADNCYDSKSEGKCVPAEEVLKNSESAATVIANAPTEAPIRAEAQKIRDELVRVQTELDQLDAQATNSSLSEARRQQANEAFALKLPSIQGLQRRWARLEKQVKDLKLPHAWIEPVPANAVPQQ